MSRARGKLTRGQHRQNHNRRVGHFHDGAPEVEVRGDQGSTSRPDHQLSMPTQSPAMSGASGRRHYAKESPSTASCKPAGGRSGREADLLMGRPRASQTTPGASWRFLGGLDASSGWCCGCPDTPKLPGFCIFSARMGTQYRAYPSAPAAIGSSMPDSRLPVIRLTPLTGPTVSAFEPFFLFPCLLRIWGCSPLALGTIGAAGE